MNIEDRLRFAGTLSGVFDNFAQSQANAKDFARINIIFRPLPWQIFNGPGIALHRPSRGLIGGWGGESAAAPTGKSFRFVRACERAGACARREITYGYLEDFAG